METSLKTGFAQIFSCYPKNLSCPNFGGAAAPLAPPGPYAYGKKNSRNLLLSQNVLFAEPTECDNNNNKHGDK